MRSRMIRGVVVSVALVALVGACGDDDEETTGAGTTESTSAAAPGPPTASGDVTIEASEYAFGGVPQTIEAGDTSFTLDNVGQEDHNLFIAEINEGFTFDEAIEAEGEEGTAEEVGEIKPVKPGEQSEKPLEANLKPGNYGMLCFEAAPDGAPHFTLGQRAEFVVE